MNPTTPPTPDSAPPATPPEALLTPPAFWMPDHFTDSAWLEHAPFAFWVIDAHRPRVLVELGTHHGFSYLAFCQAVERLATGTRCYAVDTWQGDVHAGFYGKEVLERLREYHDPRYASFSNLIQSTFEEAARHFPDGNVDLLHIDGTHLREAVQDDFDTWLPKMSSRGVILFHDVNVHRDEFGVARVWDALKERYPHFEFDHGHGLGVLAVGAEAMTSLQALWSASEHPEAAASIRQAFARLGAGVADRAARQRATEQPQQPGVTLETIEHRLRRLETALGESREHAARAEQRAAALEAQLVKTSNDSAAWRRRSDALDAQARSQANTIAEIRNSTSWRFTAPLRAVARRLIPVRRVIRRGLKVVWRTVTLQLPKKLRARRPAPPPTNPVPTVYTESERATTPGKEFEEFAPGVPASPRARLVAMYMTPPARLAENGPRGSGVPWHPAGRGLPRFVGHLQPRVPLVAESPSDALARHAEMARASGIEAFCFIYDWSMPESLHGEPVEQLLTSPDIDIGFCLMWTDRGSGQSVASAIQTPGSTVGDKLIADLARCFADHRYLRIDSRPLLVFDRPSISADASTIADLRTRLEADLGERPVVLMTLRSGDADPRRLGADGAIELPPLQPGAGLRSHRSSVQLLDPHFAGEVRSYDELVRAARRVPAPVYPLIRAVAPAWDEEARNPGRGLVFTDSTPASYRAWLDDAIDFARRHPLQGQPLVFVNAWNAWAEGSYLEPDRHFGAAYLNATARAAGDIPEPATRRAVLLVGHDAHPHGAELLLLALGRLLSARFGVRVAFLLLDGGGLLDDYRAVGDVTVLAANDPGLRDHLLGRRDEGFTSAITNTVVTGAVVVPLRDAGFRVVSLVHELPHIIHEQGWQPSAEAMFEHSDLVVFPSESVRDRMIEAFPAPNLVATVRPQGLYNPPLPPDPAVAARQRLRTQHGWSDTTTVVLGVGWGCARKGFDLFIAAAGAAESSGTNLRFVWVGDVEGGLDRWLTASTSRPTTLVQIPFTPAVTDWYSAADVLFVSSREDPFPSTVLEAIAAGVPPVAFRGCTGAEHLLEEHGALIDELDPAAALDVLRRYSPPSDRAARTAAMQTALLTTHRFDDYGFDLLRMIEPSLQRVSVIVPSYNYARYLPGRLATVFDQTYPVFEVLVLDDASTDDSVRVAAEVADQAGRHVTISPRATNSRSIFSQWRIGVEAVRGDFVWIAEADDLAEDQFLGRLMHAVNDQTVLAFTDSRTIDADGVETAPSYQRYYATVPGGHLLGSDLELEGAEFARTLLCTENLLLNTSATVMRRPDLAAVLAEQAEALQAYSFAGDWHVYLHLLQRGRVSFIARPLNAHRRHALGATWSATAATHVAEIARAHEEAARIYPLPASVLAAQRDYRRRVAELLAAVESR